jgi:hypothetical protein
LFDNGDKGKKNAVSEDFSLPLSRLTGKNVERKREGKRGWKREKNVE